MRNQILVIIIFLVAWGFISPNLTLAHPPQAKQPDKKVYVLTNATKRGTGGTGGPANELLIFFGESFPDAFSDGKDNNYNNWLVRSVALEGSAVGTETTLPVKGLSIANPSLRTVVLVMNSDAATIALLDPSKNKITITYKQNNYPSVIVGNPQKQGASGAYDAAKGKEDADIYFSGIAIGTKGSKPTYSFESKLAYLKSLKTRGAIGGLFLMDADKESNADPDRITAHAMYEYIKLLSESGPITSIFFRWNVIGGEFDRVNKTRNLTTAPEALFIFPTAQFGANYVGTIDVLAGVEAGNNYKNKLRPEGIGGFFRWKLGATAYLTALNPPVFEKIHLIATYRVRLPQQAEIFTEKIKGIEDPVSSLTRKPRHHVGFDADFMFSKAFGLTVEYRFGSLPPTFNMVDHKVTGGIKLKLAQTNK